MPEFQTTAFGDYVLQDRIGAGGMAEIFLATSRGIEGFEKRLVIKRILPTLSDDEQFVRMFIEEAKLCVALRHPNIVQVYDLGVIDGQYYIAMEYVDGRDLLKTLAACGKKKIGFPTDIALYIVMEALKGLEYAHRLERPDGQPLGIIHRDVSPSNLLLSFEGEVKIGDFGIAKASTREKTATGILKGKFGYMAPEQVTGAPIDHRADVFAVGIVLYELLTGHRLFAGKNDLMVLERVRDAVVDPRPKHYRPDLDDELEDLVLCALSKRADDRFQNAGDLHDAIHDYVYRSRAMVGPAQLARFMQGLFLSDPEEVARRNRVRLPPVPHPDEARPGAAGFGDEATRDEREAHEAAAADRAGDFDDKTPLLDLEAPSSLSEVAYISDDYEWTKEVYQRDATRSGAEELVEPQPLVEGADQERTVQTDVGIELSDADVEAIRAGSDALVEAADSQRYVSTQTPDPKGEVLAMRRAREQDDPTDFDLQDEPGYAALEGDDVKLVAAPTRDDLEAATRAGSIATELNDDDPLGDEDATRTGGGGAVEPAAIVERTRITPEEPRAPVEAQDPARAADVEPTVQFDSTVYPGLRDDDAPPDTTEAPPPAEGALEARPAVPLLDGVEGDGYVPPRDKSDFGTIELEESDMPTAEVDEADLEPLTAGPEEGTEIAAAPVPGAPTRPTGAPSAMDPFDAEALHEEDDETLLRDDDAGELAALIERHRSSAMPVEAMSEPLDSPGEPEEEDEASRTDLFDPVEEGMVAELAARAGAPARRRPLTGRRTGAPPPTESRVSRRARPVLLPAEGGEAGAPAPPSAPPAPQSGFGRRRSTPRRRVATRAPLSVVNPREGRRDPSSTQAIDVDVREEPPERAVSTIPAPVAEPRTGEIERANTGAGSLVDVEAYDGPKPSEPMGRRMSSSGITAALSEAALVDEQIAELRRSSVAPRDQTTAGQLAGTERPASDLSDDDIEATQDGHGSDLRSAILRRQSRRRMVTRSFVLYDDDGEPTREGGTFAEDSEQSVPAISDAGQLDDEGASDLFGVLSVLDEERPDFDPMVDEEVSMETDARFYGELSDSFGVRSHPRVPRIDSAQAQAEEFGNTSLGSLTPEDTGPAPMIDYGHGSEESTASVTDGQVLSVSQAHGELPGPQMLPRPGDLSGIELELTDDGPFSERHHDRVPDPSVRGDLIDDPYGAPAHFSETEEPTEEQSRDDSTGIGALRPQISEADLTSGERPSHRGGLISDSFDFGASQQARWRSAPSAPARAESSGLYAAEPEGTPDLPVRPRTVAPPAGGLEATASQLASPSEASAKPRGNLSVLRAVVERQKVARERNRAPGNGATRPTPPARAAPSAGLPAAATGSVGALAAARAAPSVGEVYPPAAQVRVDRGRTWNTVSYLLVAIAIALAVAAAVSSLLSGDGQTPLPAEPPRGGLVDAPPMADEAEPDDPAPAAPSEAEEAAKSGSADVPGTAEPEPRRDEASLSAAAEAEAEAEAEAAAEAARAKRAEAAAARAKRAEAAQEKRRRAARSRRREARAAARANDSKATLRLKCNEAVDVRISTVGTRKNKTRLSERLDPGWYRVKIFRDGEKLSQVDVNLIAGQSVSIPCP